MQHAIQPDEAADLAEYIGLVREHVGISQAELARRTGIDQAERLSRIASTLQVPAGDLFGLAGYTTPIDLPSLPVYLRTKYGQQLTKTQRTELQNWLDQIKENNN